jgi:hypothetical protein
MLAYLSMAAIAATASADDKDLEEAQKQEQTAQVGVQAEGQAEGQSGESLEEKAGFPVDFCIGNDIMSKYVTRGMIVLENPIIMPLASASYSGFTAVGAVIFDMGENKLFEVDAMLDYTHSFDNFSVSAGYNMFIFPYLDMGKTQEVYAQASGITGRGNHAWPGGVL